ncbi:hypothetical protein SprV_0100477800 [Sparganum proliferum]
MLVSHTIMKPSARLLTPTIPDLLFADNTQTESDMRRKMDLFAVGCANTGLAINADKTVSKYQSSPRAACSFPCIHVNSTEMEIVDNFAYNLRGYGDLNLPKRSPQLLTTTPTTNEVDSFPTCRRCDCTFTSHIGLVGHLRIHYTVTDVPVPGASTRARPILLCLRRLRTSAYSVTCVSTTADFTVHIHRPQPSQLPFAQRAYH